MLKVIKSLLNTAIVMYCLGLMVYLVGRVVIGDSFRWLALLNTFAPYLFVPLVIALPLALILRARLTSLMAFAFSLLAFVWFILPAITPNTIPDHEAATFKVVSFNINGSDARNLEAEVRWLLTTDADVIILPEVGSRGEDARFNDLRVEYPYHLHADFDKHLFSRYPILTWDIIRTNNASVRYDIRRIIHAVVEFDGRPVSIYAVHMPVPVTDDSGLNINQISTYSFAGRFILRYNETRRNTELGVLLDMIKNDPNPVIAAGDFNTSSYSIAYGRIASVLRDSQAEAGYGFGHTWAYAPAMHLPSFIPPFLRVDYIWHSDELVALTHEVAAPLGSDHLPVIAELAWRK